MSCSHYAEDKCAVFKQVFYRALSRIISIRQRGKLCVNARCMVARFEEMHGIGDPSNPFSRDSPLMKSLTALNGERRLNNSARVQRNELHIYRAYVRAAAYDAV